VVAVAVAVAARAGAGEGGGVDEGTVRGLPVYGIGDGRELGRVRHVYLDPGSRRVVAFGVQPAEVTPEEAPGALDPTGAAFVVAPRDLVFLATADVRSVGADAVMVADGSVLREEAPAGNGELVALDALDGRGVVAEGGGEVGQLASVAFDPATYGLSSIEVARGLLRRRSRLPGELVRNLATDPILVAREADPAGARPAEEERPGRAERSGATKATRGVERGTAPVVAETAANGAEAGGRKRKRKSKKKPLPPRGERRRAAEAGAA